MNCPECHHEMIEPEPLLPDYYECLRCGHTEWPRLEAFRAAALDIVNFWIDWTGWQFI